MISIKTINKNIFPIDFFEEYPDQKPNQQNIPKQSSKDHPKLLNPANTIKIVPSKIKEIKEIKEETIEESVDHSQMKKNNLKIIIPDNSNEDIEPSTSGSKISQNTPSNSPLTNIGINKQLKLEEKKIISRKMPSLQTQNI